MIEECEVEQETVEFSLEDTKWLAKYYIDLFFKDKTMYCGGPIPNSFLYKDRYISAVLNLDICNGMDFIYDAIGAKYTEKQLRHLERQGQLPEDVKYVIAKFRDLAKAGIPKQFAVGILLIYLELCEGFKAAA